MVTGKFQLCKRSIDRVANEDDEWLVGQCKGHYDSGW
jgi:hypothetical protein